MRTIAALGASLDIDLYSSGPELPSELPDSTGRGLGCATITFTVCVSPAPVNRRPLAADDGRCLLDDLDFYRRTPRANEGPHRIKAVLPSRERVGLRVAPEKNMHRTIW